MKRMLRFTIGLLLCSALVTQTAHAYLTATGDSGVDEKTFTQEVGAAQFYKPTGEYYFAQGGQVATNDTYQVCYGNYRTPGTAPTLQPLAPDGSTLYNVTNGINLLSVINQTAPGDQTSPTILAGPGAADSATSIYALTKTFNASPVAIPATGDFFDAAGNDTSGIVALTGANNTFFVAVQNNNDDPFGEDLSGISAGTLSRNATTGAPEFVLYNPGGTANGDTAADSFAVNFIADELGAFAYNVDADVPTTTQHVDMWYDTLLGNAAGEAGRLFVAVGIATPETAAAAAWSVGTFVVSKTASTLTLTATKCGVPTSGAAVSNRIIYAYNGTGTTDQNLKTSKVRTMHTSTGLVYLILGGSGISTTNPALNAVYAMPLVYGSEDTATDGLPADPTIFTDGAYTTPSDATTAGHFITTGSAAALVGGFNGTANNAAGIALPVGPGTGPGANRKTLITDMYVDGDAVYVAVNDPDNASVGTAESGLFKSQAVFNDLGQIDHWTDWQKVVPFDMGDTASNGAVDFAAVDGYTGHVWAINKANKAANVTQWAKPTDLTVQPGLAAAVNQSLNNLCFSVLDLNSSSTGWGADTPLRTTVFGGYEAVCFAITGSATASSATLNGTFTSLNTQMADATYDYTETPTLVVFPLPAGSGAVTCLGYSGWSSNATANGYPTPGFIMVGCSGTATTAPALYALTPDGVTGVGLNTLTVNTFSQFIDEETVPMTNVTGVPVKIQSQGGNLYVLTRSATQDLIWTASRANTVSELNSNFIVTATSGTGALATATKIYDFAISSTATATNCIFTALGTPPTGFEQLLALTSDGIYTTSCNVVNARGLNGLGLTDTPTDNAQTYAGWTRIVTPETQAWFTNYISSAAYDRAPQTFWFANFVLNNTLPKPIYNANVFYQMGRETLTNVGTTQLYDLAENPSNTVTFNGVTEFNQQTAPTIYTQFPVTARQFYNDGSRRFFVQKSPTDDTKYQVLVLPFNLYDYNITTNGKATMPDALVAESSAFYWMSPIGDTGRLMMSTNNGVIALQ